VIGLNRDRRAKLNPYTKEQEEAQGALCKEVDFLK
jgi:hypothetical protein